MNTSDIRQLYYIAPLDNLKGILRDGLLSHKRAHKRGVSDASNSEVQNLRAVKRIMTEDGKGRNLHRFVNLYIQPQNAMMWDLVKYPEKFGGRTHRDYCVLVIAKTILQRPRAFISTRNAAAKRARFMRTSRWHVGPKKARYLQSRISGSFDDFKNNSAAFRYQLQARQAEVLIPRRIDRRYITGCLVSNSETQGKVQEIAIEEKLSIPVTVHPSCFYIKSERTVPFLTLENIPELAPSTETNSEHSALSESDESDSSHESSIDPVEEDSEDLIENDASFASCNSFEDNESLSETKIVMS